MTELGRVLIVEDQPSVGGLLRDLLVDLGYGVELVADGAEALTAASRYRPDFVLLDLALPGLPGQVVLAELKRMDATVPVIVVTGNRDEDVARRTLAQGAFDYLAKPFDIDVLERVAAAAMLERTRPAS